MKKIYITKEEAEKFLFEHILKGDPGDGIPNVISSDDCFITGIRQKHLTKKKMEQQSSTLISRPEFERNESLISLWRIPHSIQDKILKQFHEQEPKDRSKLMSYFMQYKLKNLLTYLSDF